MYSLRNLCEIRDEKVDGVGPWLWSRQDNGSWEGPKNDWEVDHKAVIQSVPGKRTIIQAGGCMGMYPRLLSPYFESVYTFEPTPLSFYCLTQNCQAENIYKIQGFVGNRYGTFAISDPCWWNNMGQNCINHGKEGNIPMFRIDDLALSNVDLIWLDIEGLEIEALQGAEKTIRDYRPWLLVENGHKEEPREYITSLGYQLRLQSAADTLYTT